LFDSIKSVTGNAIIKVTNQLEKTMSDFETHPLGTGEELKLLRKYFQAAERSFEGVIDCWYESEEEIQAHEAREKLSREIRALYESKGLEELLYG
jgi:hypothetical protein